MNQKMNRLWLKEANKISFVKTTHRKKTESFWFSPKQFLFLGGFFCWPSFAFSPWVLTCLDSVGSWDKKIRCGSFPDRNFKLGNGWLMKGSLYFMVHDKPIYTTGDCFYPLYTLNKSKQPCVCSLLKWGKFGKKTYQVIQAVTLT